MAGRAELVERVAAHNAVEGEPLFLVGPLTQRDDEESSQPTSASSYPHVRPQVLPASPSERGELTHHTYFVPGTSRFALVGHHVMWSDRDSLVSIVRTAAARAGAREFILEWERGTPIIQIVVSRQEPRQREAAFGQEVEISKALGGIDARFRLADRSDVDHLVRWGAIRVVCRSED